MYRHELRFVLRFGVREQFNEFVRRLSQEERAPLPSSSSTGSTWQAQPNSGTQLSREGNRATCALCRGPQFGTCSVGSHGGFRKRIARAKRGFESRRSRSLTPLSSANWK